MQEILRMLVVLHMQANGDIVVEFAHPAKWGKHRGGVGGWVVRVFILVQLASPHVWST